MNTAGRHWEHVIIDADPPCTDLGGLAVGDIDADGCLETVVAGDGALLWYRPTTGERGVVAEGRFVVGLALHDLDGDGFLEIVAGTGSDRGDARWKIVWFDAQGTLEGSWLSHVLDDSCTGSAHDLVFGDVDGDGEDELVANAAYSASPGLFIYKKGADPTQPWAKHVVSTGIFAEGLALADLIGDGRLEIVHGPDWFSAPAAGPFAGPWQRRTYAPSLREMCRTAIVDVSGDGRYDVIAVESEYPDGRLCWYENRATEGTDILWFEHYLEGRLNFAHSLDAWRDEAGTTHIFVAEMAKGGWDAPYNWDARLIEYISADAGATWQREVLSEGVGTHQALMRDVNGDGRLEAIGKEWGQAFRIPRVHLWRQRDDFSPLERFRHRFLDRDKPAAATDILTADLDGDGRRDVVCGSWWYRNGLWERREIPGISQALCAFDLDEDGQEELVAIRAASSGSDKQGLGSDLCWLKPVSPKDGQWEVHSVGQGSGDWPHSTTIAPILPGGRLALIVGYHSAASGDWPEIFEIPADPRAEPWPKRTLAEINYGEEILPYDLDGDGLLDLLAGPYWLQNRGDGTFVPHELVAGFKVARVAVADINGDGLAEPILAEEVLDFARKVTPFSRLAWLERPDGSLHGHWQVHVIDKVRCPHSLDVADLDGDGELEIVVGEHDPFKPYRSRCRLMIYKKADTAARTWLRYTIDDRFEHHDGARVVELDDQVSGIISHGWSESRYVHFWERV